MNLFTISYSKKVLVMTSERKSHDILRSSLFTIAVALIAAYAAYYFSILEYKRIYQNGVYDKILAGVGKIKYSCEDTSNSSLYSEGLQEFYTSFYISGSRQTDETILKSLILLRNCLDSNKNIENCSACLQEVDDLIDIIHNKYL